MRSGVHRKDINRVMRRSIARTYIRKKSEGYSPGLVAKMLAVKHDLSVQSIYKIVKKYEREIKQ